MTYTKIRINYHKMPSNFRWFFPGMSQIRADTMLQLFPKHGACLIRTNHEESPGFYILSIRLYGVIRHLRLKEEGGIFFLNSKAFNKVDEQVEYFEKHDFIQGVRLNPVEIEKTTDETVDEQVKGIVNTALYDTTGDYEDPVS
jgi:hypothetical protein